MIALGRASSMLEKHRSDNGLSKIEIPEKKLKIKSILFITFYINI